MPKALRSLLFAACTVLLASRGALAHEGPDPVAHWFPSPQRIEGHTLKARLGPDAQMQGGPKLVQDRFGHALRFDGVQDLLVIPESRRLADYLPRKFLTVAVWATVDEGRPRGGLASAAQKQAEGEKGWILGYDQRVFCFSVAAIGGDDGNGRFTTIRGQTAFEPGKFYHVVGVYDGAEMRLYVNGQLEATSDQQHGPIEYARRTPYVLGGWADVDEQVSHLGLIRDVAVYDLAATSKWVAHEFEHGSELAAATAEPAGEDELRFVVSPYLQFVTADGITVMWETSRPAKGRVRYGENDELPQAAESPADATLHEVRLANLPAETGHYYVVEATDDRGRTIKSPLLSFQTANKPDTPYAFCVIGDTQHNPRVAKVLSDMMWLQRPNFILVAGDLVDTGPNKRQWTDEFFPGMQPLVSRVAFFPVLGNHEQNARHYYDYMSLPDPEYYYTFAYGNAQFFMLDSNKELGPGSEQYEWLAKQLAACRATWKFVSYHHPSYSSDEDDYGDLWRGKSEWGDLRLRPLSKLYDQYGVDIVWNGHIHSYERSWPLVDDKPVERGGTIYLVTGGGGGGLETAGPIKPYFQNNVKHGHHYCLVAVNGRTLEFKAFDFEGRLFDTLSIEKSASR
jgi:predicted phosphodiesterase